MFNILPFEIFKQDKDEVILLINYMIEKGQDAQQEAVAPTLIKNNEQKRIRVNDKTATGGWW